jgi:hypothetical protein
LRFGGDGLLLRPYGGEFQQFKPGRMLKEHTPQEYVHYVKKKKAIPRREQPNRSPSP